MSRLISFPQVFALQKGANYPLLSVFKGLDAKTLLNPAGYLFTQPAFDFPAPNLWQENSSVYELANSTSNDSLGLTYKFGGNLVNTAIKYTNGKSLGNWYKSTRHSATNTGGFVGVENNILKVKCGNTTSLLNRGLIHDVLIQRNGTQITEQSSTVIGYQQPTDTVTTSLYFKGYAEYFNPNAIDPVSSKKVGSHVLFWVGNRYMHTQQLFQKQPLGWADLETFAGGAKGWGFLSIPNSNGTYTWWCVVIADVEIELSEGPGIVFWANTNASVFSSQELQITYNNGTITWFVNGSQVAQTTLATLEAIGHVFQSTNNPIYASIGVTKGGEIETPPGVFTLCVERAVATRNLAHINTPYNRFEDTDTEVTSTDTDYHITGLHLLKKLK